MMRDTYGEATDLDGGDKIGGAPPTVAQTCDNSALPIPVPGSTGVEARPAIRCLAHGQVNPCGAFDGDHHEAAAEAGVCCRALAAPDGYSEAPPVMAPTAGGWPEFSPSDADVPPDGAW